MEKSISTWWRKYRAVESEKDFFTLQTRTIFSCWGYVKYATSLETCKEKAIEHKNTPNLLFSFINSIIQDIKEDIAAKKKVKIHNL